MSKPKIVLAPGHGGADPGAVNRKTGAREKDVNLAVSLMVGELLYPYFNVIHTRSTDVFVSLSGQAKVANDHNAPLLSIHCNSGGGTGFECFTSKGQTKSDPYATELLEQYHKANPNMAYRKDLSDGDPDKEAGFAVLTQTRGIAALFELGFIDDKDEAFLVNPDNQMYRMAVPLAVATSKFFLGKNVFEEKPTAEKPPLPQGISTPWGRNFKWPWCP